MSTQYNVIKLEKGLSAAVFVFFFFISDYDEILCLVDKFFCLPKKIEGKQKKLRCIFNLLKLETKKLPMRWNAAVNTKIKQNSTNLHRPKEMRCLT